jgi:hypothetical protein
MLRTYSGSTWEDYFQQGGKIILSNNWMSIPAVGTNSLDGSKESMELSHSEHLEGAKNL